MNKYNTNLNITNDNYINLAVYNKDTFYKIFPNSTEDDYFKNEIIADYPFRAIREIENECNLTLSGSRFVYIDDSFLDFCKKESLPLDISSLHCYLKSTSDKTCEELWYKSNRNYDLVLCSIPLIIQSIYKKKNNSLSFSEDTLKESIAHLANCFKIDKSNIYLYDTPLSKNETLINKDNFENYFNNIIYDNQSTTNFVKSIFKEFSTDCFSIKYLICGIKIDRQFKMSTELAELDSKISIDGLLLNDEMATLSEILSSNSLKYKVFPAFDRIISFKEIESSEDLLKKFLPQLIVN